MSVAVGIVAELREHPGAEDHAEAGSASVDLSVWVLAKTLLHLPGQYLLWATIAASTAISADAYAA